MSDLAMVVPYKNPGYGAIELKLVAQMAMTKAMVISTVMMFGSVGSYYGVGYLLEEDEPVHMVRLMKYTDLGPPPSIQNQQAAPSVAVATAQVKPSIGIPVPVPDAEVNPEQTIATQTELSQTVGPETNTEGTGGGEIQIEDDGPPPDFVPYEKEPVIVKSVKPIYPEIALRAGVEGNVFVKIWVDKEGKARKAVIIKSDAPIFDQAAIDAAMQHVFTPAVMQKGPVAVWVSIPFRFRLSSSR